MKNNYDFSKFDVEFVDEMEQAYAEMSQLNQTEEELYSQLKAS